MALTGTHFVNRAAQQLHDTENVRWSRAYLLACLNEAQRTAVQIEPEVNPVTAALELQPGSLQNLPEGAYKLIKVNYNLGLDGQTQGRAITPTEREPLDKRFPGWSEVPAGDATTAPEVKHFVYDIRDRLTLYVYPAQPQGTSRQISITYAGAPTPLGQEDHNIGIDDIYEAALLNFVLARAYQRDISAEGQGVQMAEHYHSAFFDLLLGRDEQQDADLTIRHETTERPNYAMRGQRRRR